MAVRGARRAGRRRRCCRRCATRCPPPRPPASWRSTTRTAARRAPELFAALRDEGALTLRVWQSLPAEPARGRPRARRRAGRPAAHRLRQGVHGRHARLAHRPPARRQRRGDHERGGAGARSSGARRPRASPSPSTPSATARTARRSTPSRPRAADWRTRGCGRGSSTPSASIPTTCRASRRLGVAASVQYTHATSDRDVADRLWGERAAHAYPYRSLLDAGARAGRRLGRARSRRSTRSPACARRCGARTTSARRGGPSRRSGSRPRSPPSPPRRRGSRARRTLRGRLAPGLLADLVVLDRDPLADLDGARVIGTMLGRRAGPSHLQEAHDPAADLDLVAVAQARLAHAPPVDVDAVAAAVVGDHRARRRARARARGGGTPSRRRARCRRSGGGRCA